MREQDAHGAREQACAPTDIVEAEAADHGARHHARPRERSEQAVEVAAEVEAVVEQREVIGVDAEGPLELGTHLARPNLVRR